MSGYFVGELISFLLSQNVLILCFFFLDSFYFWYWESKKEVGRDGRRVQAYHHYTLQIRVHAPGVFPCRWCRSASAPGGDISALFGQFGGVGAADLEFEHRFAEFDFAEEEEPGIARDVRLAVVG